MLGKQGDSILVIPRAIRQILDQPLSESQFIQSFPGGLVFGHAVTLPQMLEFGGAVSAKNRSRCLYYYRDQTWGHVGRTMFFSRVARASSFPDHSLRSHSLQQQVPKTYPSHYLLLMLHSLVTALREANPSNGGEPK